MIDRYEPLSPRAVRWVERTVGPGARMLRAVRLTGGITSNIDRITLRTPGNDAIEVVLRRYRGGSGQPVGLIHRESAALTAIADHDIAAPGLLAADATGKHAGVPCLLMTALPGKPWLPAMDLPAFVQHLAAVLTRIHNITGLQLDPTDPHTFHADADRSWLTDPGLARTLVHAATNIHNVEPSVLVHGDYQPMNVLWTAEKISGVIDWTYTGTGRRAMDVGHCRLALAVLYSAETAEEFLRCYESEAGHPVDPRHDIRALLTYNPNWPEYAEIAAAENPYIDRAGITDRLSELLRATAERLG
jgi:aminoglycoside phosphotransferase (APT) family kinase protein